MRNILHDLYRGRIIPWERRDPDSEKHREILKQMEDAERYFLQKLSPDDCQRFQALSRLHTELSDAEEDHLFSYAFTLGVLLAMDVMREAEVIANG